MNPKYLTMRGQYRINNMFFETCNKTDLPLATSGVNLPEYTLSNMEWKDSSGNTYQPMRELFIACGDPTGYKFALEVLGSYEHYQLLLSHSSIGPIMEEWVEEVKASVDSFAVNSIQDIVTNGGSQVQLSAAKFLASREYEEKGEVGRPATDNKKRKLENHAKAIAKDTAEEMERLGITH